METFMNLTKKAFALFLLASLTAGQAQAATVECSTDKVVGAILNKVAALLEKEDLSRIIFGLGLSGTLGVMSHEFYKGAHALLEKRYYNCDDVLVSNCLKMLSVLTATCSLAVGISVIEDIYNA